jgi:hypothetical protein
MIKQVLALSLAAVSVTAFSQTDTTALTTTSVSTNAYSALPAENDQEVYKLKAKVDIPVIAIGAGWSIYGFSQIYSKDRIPVETVRNLSKEDVNGFDRWAAGKSSEKAANTSDLLFYGSMPLPILLLADKHIRRDAAKIGVLYLEAMSVTGLLYTGSTYLTDRYRPETYDKRQNPENLTSGGNKNSFFAGHVALVGTATFFTAKVFADYHPESKLRHVFYGVAIASTAATGYLRHRAGKHFPSDIILGTAVGTLSGILVPHFHKNKLFKNPNISMLPFTTGQSHGLAMTYKFK